MKGLLLKDVYMMKRYCRSYLLIAAVFLVISFVGNGNLFYLFYPCLLCGMIPCSLLGYDEQSHFLQYSATLPYTKKQIVSAKYLLGLFAQIAVLFATGITQAIRMTIHDQFVFKDFAILLLSVLVISAIASSISMPFIFKLGVEKGRIAYYVMIGFVCAASFGLSKWFAESFQNIIVSDILFLILSLLGIVLYIFSWCLSVVFYEKREL